MEKNCFICGNPLPLKRGPLKYCSQGCRSRAILNQYRNKNPKSLVPTATIGAIAEYRVMTELLQRGYDVFHAASPSCSCDLAILKDSKLLRIEVTTGKYTPTGKIFYPPHKNDNYDIIAVALPDLIYYFPELPT